MGSTGFLFLRYIPYVTNGDPEVAASVEVGRGPHKNWTSFLLPVSPPPVSPGTWPP